MHCAICKCKLNKNNIARKIGWYGDEKDGEIRLDSMGREWCQECAGIHDSIDWEIEFEKSSGVRF